MIEVVETELKGLFLIQATPSFDTRGYFLESYNMENFLKFGLTADFVQDNQSCSRWGVIRGLHYQYDPPMTKLIRCVSGVIQDVVVDIRVGSPTFGKYFTTTLSGHNMKMLWISGGFAHGFLAVEDSIVWYKCTKYNPKGEAAIRWDDQTLDINWKTDLMHQPFTISDRDARAQTFEEYKKNPKFKVNRLK